MDLMTARVYALRCLMTALVYAPQGSNMNDKLTLDCVESSFEEIHILLGSAARTWDVESRVPGTWKGAYL